jgi:hypothetical protein
MLRRDAVAAAVMLAVAAVAAVESVRLLPYGAVRAPGAGFFPWWTSVALAVLSLALLGQAWRQPGGRRFGAGTGRLGKVAGVLVVLAAYALVVDALGYPLATFLVVLFMLRVTEPQPWPVALGVATLVAGGSYLVFAVWLSVPLPAGPLAR